MENTFSLSDTMIVVPAFLISAGILFYTAVQAALVGAGGHRRGLYSAFTIACLCGGGFQLATAAYYTADSVGAAAYALHWQAACTMVFFPALFAFIAFYTDQRRIRPWFIVVVTVFSLLLIISLTQPFSARFSSLEDRGVLRLPWGELLATFKGTPGRWSGLSRLGVLAIFSWAVARTVTQYRNGERRAALFLAGYLVVQVGTIIQGTLIDHGVIHSFYTAGFAFLALAVLMSLSLGMELRDHALRLEAAGQDLRREIERRKDAEEAIRDSEERFRRLAEGPFEGIAITDEGRFIDTNSQFEKMLGYNHEELIGMQVSECVAPESRELVTGKIKSGNETPYEHIALRSDGSKFPVEVFGRTIPYKGRKVRVTAIRDITERKRAEAEVQRYVRRLQVLSARLVEVQEIERRSIARELHDQIGQVLTGLKLTLEMCLRKPPDRIQESLQNAQSLADDLVSQVREISLKLRPSMLDDLGLLPTLLWHFEHYTAQTEVNVAFRHIGLDRRFGPQVETAAYRIIQEALTNVARHAGVKDVEVRCEVDPKGLRIEIEDRGIGFDPSKIGPISFGLVGMRERAELLGGRFSIKTAAGSGTLLTVRLPLAMTEATQPGEIR
jgi:PAS domain S-box-containing protein